MRYRLFHYVETEAANSVCEQFYIFLKSFDNENTPLIVLLVFFFFLANHSS